MIGKNLPKILLLDGDEALGRSLVERLNGWGLDAQYGSSPADGLKILVQRPADVLFLNTHLRETDGASYGEILRFCEKNSVPIIFLLDRGGEKQRLEILETGQDVMLKPLHMDELKARIRAILRRSASQHPMQTEGSAVLREMDFEFFSAMVSPRSFSIQFPNGRRENIGRKVLGLLLFFFRHRGEILSRYRVVYGVWGPHGNPHSRSLDQYLVRIRELFHRNGMNGQAVIRTIHGVGYLYAEPSD
jgi:DNA-binding response OmpR family regulator